MARRRRARRLLAGISDPQWFGKPGDADAERRGDQRPNGVPTGIGGTERIGSSVGGPDSGTDAGSDGEADRPARGDTPADASSDAASDASTDA